MHFTKTSLLALALISSPLIGFDSGLTPRVDACTKLTKLLAVGAAFCALVLSRDLIEIPVPQVSLEECNNTLVVLRKRYPVCPPRCIRASDEYVLNTGDWQNFNLPSLECPHNDDLLCPYITPYPATLFQ